MKPLPILLLLLCVGCQKSERTFGDEGFQVTLSDPRREIQSVSVNGVPLEEIR